MKNEKYVAPKTLSESVRLYTEVMILGTGDNVANGPT